MAKYNDLIKEKAVTLIEDDFFSVSQVCKVLNISRQTFYNWMDEKPDFSDSINSALNRRSEILLAMAYSSVRKRLKEGKTIVERDTYVPDERNPDSLKLKSKVIIKKDYMPDLRTIKMILGRNDKLQKVRDKATVETAQVYDEKVRTEDLSKQEISLSPEVTEQESEILTDVIEDEDKQVMIENSSPVQPKTENVKRRKKMAVSNIKKRVKIVKF